MGNMDCMVCNMCKRVAQNVVVDGKNVQMVKFFCTKSKEWFEVDLMDSCHLRKEKKDEEQ